MTKMLEAMKDPKFLADMSEYFAKIERRKQSNMKRLLTFFSDDSSFEVFINKLIEKHGERWVDQCYKNGFMPYPWHLLYSVFELAEKDGKEVEPLDGLTKNFPSILYEYRGYTFAITHGQGTCTSIYNKEKELIYRD